MAFGTPGIGTTSAVQNAINLAAGGGGIGAAGAAGGGGGMSLGTIFAIVSGLQLLLGLLQPSQKSLMETQGDVATKTQKDLMDYRMEMAGKSGVNPPYQSPFLGELDPMVLQALMTNYGNKINFGQPAGQSMNTDFITQALSNMANIPPLSTGPPKAPVYPPRGEWNYPGLPI